MLSKLEGVAARYEEIGMQLAQPETIQNQENWRKLMKEHADLTPLVEAYHAYKEVCEGIDGAKELLNDPDMRAMAQDELDALTPQKGEMQSAIQRMLLPKDPNDGRNVIIEIRAGAGGDEAALFGADLFRMYQHYADAHGWKVEPMDVSMNELGGFKEASFMIEGKGVYSRLKYESGVHRVQRVPDTEASGRIHTSTTTVAVLPEVEAVEVEINQGDLRIDTYRAGGAGGQHVNRTDSAVRITHLPSGIVVQCQNERSQMQNKEQAMRSLRAKLHDAAQARSHSEYAENRRAQVGTGDRSERIRTYNFPQGRVTDHRIGLTLYKLDGFLNGDMEEMLDALIVADQAEQLQQVQGA